TMLRREVPEAREILRNLIVGRSVCPPRPETRLYEFSGRGSLGRPRGRDGQFSFGGDPGGFHQEYVSVGVVRRGRRGPRRLGSTRGFGQDGGAHRRLQGLRLGTDRSSSQPNSSRGATNCSGVLVRSAIVLSRACLGVLLPRDRIAPGASAIP